MRRRPPGHGHRRLRQEVKEAVKAGKSLRELRINEIERKDKA